MNLHAHLKIAVIKKNSEIKELLARGKKVHTKYGIFFINNESNAKRLHFAVLIKKSVGNAVWRNYCKRIVRSYIRNRIDYFIENKQVIFVYTFEGKIRYNLLEEEFDKKLAFL
jgi:ribonuclease P protein component